MAFFGLSFAAPSIDDPAKDNPLFTCYTNPCVQVDGVGKIMGSTKVKYFFMANLNKFGIVFCINNINIIYFLTFSAYL